MNKILFIDSTVSDHSRTKALAEHLLSFLEGEISLVRLEEEHLSPLDTGMLAKREALLSQNRLSDAVFSLAHRFAEAETVVIAAPFWDMSFPSMLKVFLEHVCVGGVTFRYENGVPVSLCKAKKLYFVSTSGGKFVEDFGFGYIKSLATDFFGIKETVLFFAEMLDVFPEKEEALIAEAKSVITDYFS